MHWRRRGTQSRWQFRNEKGDSPVFPVGKYLLGYAANLLNSHAWTDEFIRFVLDALSPRCAAAVASVIVPECDRLAGKGGETGPADPRKRQDKERFVYREVLEQLEQCGPGKPLRRLHLPDGRTTKFGRTAEHSAEHVAECAGQVVRSPHSAISSRELERLLAKAVGLDLENCLHNGDEALPPELEEIRQTFALSSDDMDVVCFLYCYSQSLIFQGLCDEHRGADAIQLMAAAMGLGTTRVRKAVGEGGRLMQIGLIEKNFSSIGPAVELDEAVVSHLAGLADGTLAQRYCRKDSGSTFALETFGLPERQLEIAASLLRSKRPCHILLHGEAGTGKTEFARSATAAAGLAGYFVKEGEKGVASDRKLELHAAVSAMSADKGVLIMDEADTLINTEGSFIFGGRVDKGWINDFMDRSKCAMLWIVNDFGAAPQSVRRRFDYSLEFKPFTRRQREEVWRVAAAGTAVESLLSLDMIRELSARYRVNAAGVASAVKAAQHVVTTQNASEAFVRETLEELLKRHQELTVGKAKQRRQVPVSQYDLSALNTDVPSDRLAGSLEAFVKTAPWDSDSGGRMNLLFWGLPGTGKTEFAKYLASSLGLDLILKPASELLSCWLGGTEKNIAAAFDEAQREQAILFIDEADSFFTERQAAFRSWEVTQTNELLEQMENHRGILICCTNLLANLDRAALRRFTWKVEFKPLTSAGAAAAYQKYFGARTDRLTAKHKKKLHAIRDLTLGDFRAVSDRYGQAPDTTHDELLLALETEAAYRSPSHKGDIGFKGG